MLTRTRSGGIAVLLLLAVSGNGCTCQPQPTTPDGSTPVVTTPAWPEGAMLEVSATTSTSATLRWPAALGDVIGYRLTIDGQPRELTALTETLTGLTAGRHLPSQIVAFAADGTETTALLAEVAPAEPFAVSDGDISTDFCGANAFLVAPTANITCEVFSVVIGRVTTSSGSGVPGMRVSVVGHPEWGATTSQSDGTFAIGVAAGRLTLQLSSTSFLSIQRTVTALARRFTHVPPTAVLRRDTKATTITPSAGGFHAASPTNDSDGPRTTSVFIPPGSVARLRFADGGTQPAATLTLRATEATVGAAGPATMPATLPGATAYTFAADVSADEALAAGAQGIDFDAPVAVYADNFLEYPVGSAVPLGLYSETLGRWESAANAAVVQVTAGGGLDVTGDGVADTTLPLLPGEQSLLSERFAPGTQLVRSLTTHFSAFDTNPCWRCVGSCEENGSASTAGTEPNCDCASGSLIRLQNQTLSEFAAVAGTGLTLAWHSHRGNVRKPSVDLSLGLLKDGGMPVGTKGTYFRIEVAGQSYVVEHLDGGVGDALTLGWDGKDAFGRAVRGPVAATASTGYGFGATSFSGGGGGASTTIDYTAKDFGVWPPPGAQVMASTREAVFFLKHHSLSLGDWVPRENLGNFSLDVLHGYSEDGTLHLGNGAHRPAAEGGPVVHYVTGGGGNFAEDAGADTLDTGPFPFIEEGPQGLFFVEKQARIRLLPPDGGVRTVAGDINTGFAGDGLDARAGRFDGARALTTDRDGNLYIADTSNFRIRKLERSTGLLSTIVGSGTQGYSPDDTPALQARLDGLTDIMVGVDGYLYFMAADNMVGTTLRRVEGGVIKTMAGGYAGSDVQFEGDAKGIAFRGGEHWLAQSPDGTLFVAGYDSGGGKSDYVVRRIEADGRVRLIAGGGSSVDPEETDARATCFSGFTGLAVGDDGTVYIGESGTTGCGLRGPGVRAVYPDGTMSLFLGGVRAAPSGSRPADGAAAATLLNGLGEVTMRRNGKLLVVHRGPTTTLHEVSLPTLNASRLVPSPDGEEVYAFDARGRHLRTVSARTGLLLWQFTWGANGLSSIIDVNGDVTTVEREASGAARALVAQDGQRTELTLDAQGRVTRITDSEGRFVEAAYKSDADGLLQEWKDENGHATAFEWDANGNLLTHTNARNAKKRFAKTSTGVDFTSAEQRLTQYLQQRGASGGTSQVTAYADATVSSRRSVFSQREFESREGVVTEVVMQAALGARFGRAVEVPGDVSISTPEGLRANISSRRTSVNAPGNLFDVTEEVEETRINGKLWTTRYDGVAKTSRATSPLGRVATATLDAKLRPMTVDVPGLLQMTLAYDSRGRLLSLTQGVRSHSFVYGPRGFLETSTNVLSETTRFTTDATGRVTQVTRADTSAIGLSQDNAGNLSSVTPPGTTAHSYGYTAANELISYTPPMVSGSGPESRTVDLDGLTTTLTHANATGSVVTREPSGRVERVTTPWWTNVFTYIPTTGQVQSLTRGGQRLEYRYDGALLREEKALGIAPATSTWGYDSDFRVTSHGIGGDVVAVQYDDDAALLGVGPVSLTRVPTTGQLGSVAVGSVVTSVVFNGYGETSSRSVPSLYSEALTYDAAGRIVLVNEVVEGIASQFVYTNDSQGRLTSVSVNGGAATAWTYSPHGNRLTENGVSSTYDVQDRLLSRGATTYTWDAMGSRLSMTSGGQTTRYVHEGRALKSVTLPDGTVIGYEYDGRQRRVARTRNGVVTARWIYEGQYRVVAEVDAAGAVVSRFVYASEGHSPDAMVRGGVTYAYVKNHLGTVKLVVNAATGAVVQRIESDAWGNVLFDSNPGFQPFIFAGGVYDIDTRLTHFGFRDYDSASGSWLTPEPLSRAPGYVGQMAQGGVSAPTYSYAASSPVGHIDSTGLETEILMSAPMGWGPSSLGHVAVSINGQVFSFARNRSGGSDMEVSPFANYWADNDATDLLGVQLLLSTEQEAGLERTLRWIGDNWKWSSVEQNCVRAAGSALNSNGLWVMGTVMPHEFVRSLLQHPSAVGQAFYPSYANQTRGNGPLRSKANPIWGAGMWSAVTSGWSQ